MGETGEAGRGRLVRRGGVVKAKDVDLGASFKKGESSGVRGALNWLTVRRGVLAGVWTKYQHGKNGQSAI
jgi:hypothetical protein